MNDNIVIGPWVKLPKKKRGSAIEKEVMEEMKLKSFAEDITEQTCVQMIQTLHENEFDVDGTKFLRDIGFVIECIKALIYREIGLQHPMADFITLITKPMSDLPDNPEGNVDAEKLLAVTKYISDIKYEKLLNDIGVDDEDPEVS